MFVIKVNNNENLENYRKMQVVLSKFNNKIVCGIKLSKVSKKGYAV